MSASNMIHEDRMRRSLASLPRVGGGVGVGVRGGKACMPFVSPGANLAVAPKLTSQPRGRWAA